jgi:hypothetical protein
VTQDTSGQPIAIHHYTVLRGTGLNAISDSVGVVLGGDSLMFLDSTGVERQYYSVKAVAQ